MNIFISKLAAIIRENEIRVPKTIPNERTFDEGLRIVFGIAAAVAVLIMSISALRIVISRGNSQDVAKARDAILYSAIGLVITLTAFAIVTFVIGRV